MKTKSELLENFLTTLKAAGFEVYVPEKPSTYAHFVKDNKIGYVQEAYFGGLEFSTVHKPSHENGTGFGLNRNGLFNPTIKDAEMAFMIAPYKSYSGTIKKYKSWGEYISSPVNQIIKYVEF
jgi:hypothetical protein